MSKELLKRAKILMECAIDEESALFRKVAPLVEEIEAELAKPEPEPLSKDEIRKILVENGFKIYPEIGDLKPYVYESIRAIERALGIE